MAIDGIIDIFVSMFSKLIGLYKQCSFSFSGLTVNYWQIILGVLLIGLVVFTFWRGART